MEDFTFENPPLIEARCFFQFSGGEPWDWTVPGRFWSTIKDTYPTRARLKRPSTSNSEELDEGEPLVFRNKEKNQAVHVGPDGLSINFIQPYGGWPKFKTEIENVLNSYWAITQPDVVRNVTLTYINRLVTPNEAFHYDEFLNVHISLPTGRRDMGWINWAQRVDIWREELESILTIKAGTARLLTSSADSHDVRVILELEVEHGIEDSLPKEAMPGWIEAAHEEIKSTFLDSLTDLSKKSLGFKERNNATNF